MAIIRILIVDDEKNQRSLVRSTIDTMGLKSITIADGIEPVEIENIEIEEAHNGQEAIEKYKQKPFDIVIMDIKMPEMNGITAIEHIKKIDPKASVIMMTAHASKEILAELEPRKYYDFFQKQYNVTEMRIVIKRALINKIQSTKVVEMSKQLHQRYDFSDIIGASSEMQKVLEIIKTVSENDVTVLICGESGTGKELVAKAIHFNSSRKKSPFIPINCVAIPETLLESELFGYERGAFTGAVRSKIGKFELAVGGTLFLDEIGDMNQAMQAKILRALQEKEIQRVGGTQTIKTNVRIITATNKDLGIEVREKRFREDLYFRLNVITVYLPPLRQRTGDISLLCDHFIQKYSNQLKKDILGISQEVLAVFLKYPWPGNIRELENVIQRGAVLAKDKIIKLDDIPSHIIYGENQVSQTPMSESNINPVNLSDHVSKITEQEEKKAIYEALQQTKWRRGEAAKILGITRRTLLRKMHKYGLNN